MGDVQQLRDWPADRRSLGVGAVARLIEVHRDTVWKWIKFGVQDLTGRTVRLAATRLGGTWRIDKASLRMFFALCAGQDPNSVLADPEEAARCQERMLASLKRKRP